jgi:hypothetical protein
VNGVDVVARLRREQVGTDRYGNPVFELVESEISELALFAPSDSRQAIAPAEVGRDAVVSEPTLYWFKAWPDIRASDRLRVRGVEYEVLSIPADWRSASIGGLVVKLRDSTEGVP